MENAEVLKAAKENKRLYDELTKAAMPLLEFLKRDYDPQADGIVTEGRVENVRGEVSALLPVRD